MAQGRQRLPWHCCRTTSRFNARPRSTRIVKKTEHEYAEQAVVLAKVQQLAFGMQRRDLLAVVQKAAVELGAFTANVRYRGARIVGHLPNRPAQRTAMIDLLIIKEVSRIE